MQKKLLCFVNSIVSITLALVDIINCLYKLSKSKDRSFNLMYLI